jgi:ADP-ribosylglycohydrolase
MGDPFLDRQFLLKMELVQRQEEGCETAGIHERLNKHQQLTAEEIETFYRELEALPVRAEFPYDEPSDLAEIIARRPNGPRRLPCPHDEVMADKLKGAWWGRAAGCQLGKPVEGMPRHDIETYLKAAGAYPLDDYVPLLETPPVKVMVSAPQSTRGNFREMARDDDIDYTILGLHILEKYGTEFSTQDVADTWLSLLPYHMVFTAERVTYRNLVNDMPAEQAGRWRNPYREWIGAQIRADGWAYGAAAYPEKAAEFAWRDARLSHVKNGIYGEMWAAALIAGAFGIQTAHPTLQEIERLIRIGLSEIPARCRLAEAVEQVITWRQETDDWREAWERINSRYGHYHWVHTINNALLVTLGLLHGDGDFSRSICIAVMGGWDTDCNGATVGSVLGALLGANRLPDRWIAPLNDTARSAVIGYDGSRFSDLAQGSLHINRQLATLIGPG